MYQFVEISCVIVELFLIYVFQRSAFYPKKQARWVGASVYSVFGLIVIALSFWEGASVYRMIFSVVGILVLTLLMFDAALIPALFISLAFCAVVALTDMLVYLMLSLVGLSGDALMQNGSTRSLYVMIEHIALLGLIAVICLINRRGCGIVSTKTLLPLLPCCGANILLCCLLCIQASERDTELNPLYIAVSLGLLYTNIVIIYFTNRIEKQEQLKRDAELTAHHYAMQKEYYEQLHTQQEETRALWHDISKYLRAMQAEQVSSTLKQVQTMVDSISNVVDVNNRVVSVILNEYVQAASDIGVEFDMDVQVPQEVFVTAADLYVLLGNTLDNALEACSELAAGDRKIVLQLRMHNEVLFFKISNPYKDSHLSRKRNQFHGYGLKNVQHCVDKYHGSMEICTENGIFSVSAYLNGM